MAKLKVNQDRVTREAAKQLEELCPFGAISEENGILSISSGCRMCRICAVSYTHLTAGKDWTRIRNLPGIAGKRRIKTGNLQ